MLSRNGTRNQKAQRHAEYDRSERSDDGPIATPAIDGGDVFATGPHGHLLALELRTGKVRWRHDLVAREGVIRCWTLVTDGRALLGEHELAFTVKMRPLDRDDRLECRVLRRQRQRPVRQ